MKSDVANLKVVLFVGGFRVPKSGTEGGQVFASRSLVDSPLKHHVRWKLVDTTQRSEPPPGILVRAFDAAWRMIQVIWQLCFTKVDVVLTFSNFMALSILEKGFYCLLGRMLGKRTVMSFRFHPSIPRRFAKFFHWYISKVCRSCDRIICQSGLASDELIRLFGVDRDRIEVIQNWIDTSRFLNPPVRKPAPDNVIRIIYAGWLHPKKGIQHLMPAMRLLADQRADFELTICGSGSLYGWVQTQRVELGLERNVEVLGWVKNEEVFQRFFQADIFLLPSLAEGMPNALLQAMGCGLPVVTTNVSSIPAIIEDGRNGSLIEPGSAQAICDGLLRLLARRSEWGRIGELNRQQILAGHDIATVWPRIGKVLGLSISELQ